MSHRNFPLSELGRLRLARCVVEEGWPLRRAAERFQVAVTTAARWAARYRELGAAGHGRSQLTTTSQPKPNPHPHRTPHHQSACHPPVGATPDRLSLSACTRPPCTGCSPATGWPNCDGSTDPPAGSFVGWTADQLRRTRSTSTSRNWARSPPAEAGGCWAARRGTTTPGPTGVSESDAVSAGYPLRGRPLPAHRNRWVFTAGLLASRCPMNAKRPLPRSGSNANAYFTELGDHRYEKY